MEHTEFYDHLDQIIKSLQQKTKRTLDLLEKSQDLYWDNKKFPFEKLLTEKEEKILDYIYISDFLSLTEENEDTIKKYYR